MLAAALLVNDTLTYLDLHSNDTGDEGAKQLAAALKVNESLKHLSLHSNGIVLDGVKGVGHLVTEL